jgi:tRNA threonylcarbamoyladenosine biosynthesis protein TsaB
MASRGGAEDETMKGWADVVDRRSLASKRAEPPPARRDLLLAIDTSTAQAGLALYDGDLLAELTWPAGRHGSQTVLAETERLLALAGRRVDDITAVGIALGPGSFSALRVGMSLAKGLAFAGDRALIGIPTLDVVSYPHRHAGRLVWAILDAGRGRVVAAPYTMNGTEWQACAAPYHGPVAALVERITDPALVAGEAPPAMIDALTDRADVIVLPPAVRPRRPGALAELAWARLRAGDVDDPFALEPLYLHGDGGGQRAVLP